MTLKFFIPFLLTGLFTDSYSQPVSQVSKSEIYTHALSCSVEVLVNGRLEGTGFIVSEDGYAITVLHALKENAKLEIRSRNLGRLKATLIGQSRGDDAALLKIPCKADPYPYLQISEKAPLPGDEVFLIGTPVFRNRVFIKGFVAGSEPVYEFYRGNYNEVIHVSAMTAKGCSGGPWLNKSGEIVGMQAANVTIGNVLQGIASMVPAKRLKKLAEAKKTTSTPTLEMAFEAIWEQSHEKITNLPKDTRGLIIRQVKSKGIAANKGIKEWDILLKANDKRFEESADLIRYLRNENKMKVLELEVMDAKNHKIRVIKIQPKEL